MRDSWLRRTELNRIRTTGVFAATLIALCATSTIAIAEPQGGPADTPPVAAAVPLSPEAQEMLRELLSFDPAREASRGAAPRKSGPASALDWKRTEKPDGSSALSVKQPMQAWDGSVGADFSLSGASVTGSPDHPLPTTREQNSGAAWADVAVPGVASINARVEPGRDQNKVGTTFSRSLPLGTGYSITLQNSYAITESNGSTPIQPVLAGTTATQAAPPSQVWSTERLVKFNILSTGTTLGAATSSSTVSGGLHNKFSAEQKLFGPLSVTTAVTDPGAATSSKSIIAGFKFNW